MIHNHSVQFLSPVSGNGFLQMAFKASAEKMLELQNGSISIDSVFSLLKCNWEDAIDTKYHAYLSGGPQVCDVQSSVGIMENANKKTFAENEYFDPEKINVFAISYYKGGKLHNPAPDKPAVMTFDYRTGAMRSRIFLENGNMQDPAAGVPALAAVWSDTGNLYEISHYQGGQLQDPAPTMAARLHFSAKTGVLKSKRHFTNNMERDPITDVPARQLFDEITGEKVSSLHCP